MKYLDYSKYLAWRDRFWSQFEASPAGVEELHPDYIGLERFFGPSGLDPAVIRVVHREGDALLSGSLIASFADKVAELMRVEQRLYDGPPSALLVDYDFHSERPLLTIQPVDYALQAGTCFALDLPDDRFADFGGSLRDYYRYDCIEPSPANNPLAICLGVCGMLIIEEDEQRYLLSVMRSSRLASLGGTVGPSVAGVVDYRTDYKTLQHINEVSLGTEICEELALRQDEFEIVPLGWALELYRGERPQIFSLVKTLLNREQISRRLESISGQAREFASYEFIEIKVDKMFAISTPDTFNLEAAMNWLLVMEFLGQ